MSLLYAAESDDGYSRMWLVPTAGGTPFALSSRRDNYPLQWSVSGKEILFIEGNAFQGESTALYHVSPTGSRRLLLVSGRRALVPPRVRRVDTPYGISGEWA